MTGPTAAAGLVPDVPSGGATAAAGLVREVR